jgi:hypothetical protein
LERARESNPEVDPNDDEAGRRGGVQETSDQNVGEDEVVPLDPGTNSSVNKK